MATKRYIEDTLDGIKDYYGGEDFDVFNSMISTIETERSVDILRVGCMEVGESAKETYPKIEIVPDNTDHDYGFEGQPLVEPWILHHGLLWVTHRWADLSVLQRTLWRYIEAINRLNEADDTYGDRFVWVQLGTEDYTPMMQDAEARNMMQGVSVSFTCQTR